MNSHTSPLPKAIFAVAAVSALAIGAFTMGASRDANAQQAAVAPSVAVASLDEGVDWSKVAHVPASPAQSVAAYDR